MHIFLRVIILIFLFVAPLCAEFNLKVSIENWVANYEYLGISQREGETLFGDIVRGRFGYKVFGNSWLYGGILLKKDYNGEGIDKVYPLISFHFRPNEKTELIFGSINIRHDFHPALYDPIRYYVKPYSDGIEFLYNSEKIKIDTFFDWELYDTVEHPEKFSFSTLFGIDLGRALFNFQTRWNHHGGQLYPHEGINVIHDISLGGGVNLKILEGKAINLNLSSESFFSWYRSDVNKSLDNNGHGISNKIILDLSNWILFYEYWTGKNFFNEEGDPLYRADNMHRFSAAKEFRLYKDYVSIRIEFNARYVGKFCHDEKIILDVEIDKFFNK